MVRADGRLEVPVKDWYLTVVQRRALAELYAVQLSCLPFLNLSPT